MIYSLFMSPLHQAWPDVVNDPADSKIAYRIDNQGKFNILYKKVEQFSLDTAATRTLSLFNFDSTEWLFLIVRCIGSGRINTSGFDTNGSTPISGKIGVYGNRIFPGIAIISTYNNSSFIVESLSDDSLFEVFAAVACADNDARMDTNA
jgi:hypothetical protein